MPDPLNRDDFQALLTNEAWKALTVHLRERQEGCLKELLSTNHKAAIKYKEIQELLDTPKTLRDELLEEKENG